MSFKKGGRVYPAYLEGRTEVSQRQVAQRDSLVSLPRSSISNETKIVHEKRTSTRERTDDHPILETARSKVGHAYSGRYIALAMQTSSEKALEHIYRSLLPSDHIKLSAQQHSSLF
jgi:hypothetical protein